MAIVSFTGYRPSKRFPPLVTPWTLAHIDEGIAKVGPWTRIETAIALDPLDADPTNPAVRAFSTANATAESGLWYRVVFEDAEGNTQATVPEYNGYMAIPTATEVREESNVVFEEYGYPEPEPGYVDRLDTKLLEARTWLEGLTGLDLDAAEILEDKRLPLIRAAIRMLVEYAVAGSTMEILESAADFDLLQSFSAAGYSETRRGAGFGRTQIHPWPALSRLLNLILYFDSQGREVMDGPSIGQRGVSPYPGSEIMEAETPEGMFDPPIVAGIARVWYRGTG